MLLPPNLKSLLITLSFLPFVIGGSTYTFISIQSLLLNSQVTTFIITSSSFLIIISIFSLNFSTWKSLCINYTYLSIHGWNCMSPLGAICNSATLHKLLRVYFSRHHFHDLTSHSLQYFSAFMILPNFLR